MRWLAVPVVLALLLASGLAVAQDGPSRSPQPDACRQDCPPPCEDRPDDRCPRDAPDRQRDANASRTPEPRSTPPRPTPQDRPAACEDADCDAWKGRDGLKWIAFGVEGGQLVDYTVRGTLVLDALALDAGEWTLHRGGGFLEARGEDARLRLHDDVVGLVEFRGHGDATLTLDLPDGATVEPVGDHGYRLLLPGGRTALLRAGDVAANGDNLTIMGFAALHLPAAGPRDAASGSDGPRNLGGRDVERSKERGHYGAEVRIHRPGQGVAPQAGAGVESVTADADVLAYDDLDVAVDPVPAAATPETPVRVVVSAELEGGRTVSLALDPDLFPGLASAGVDAALDLRYFDLHDDGTETEVVFRQAASLADVLDPTDDDGQPEFWVVLDAQGLQVLVSVPHWSAHAITLASIAETVLEPSVLVGVVAGVGGAVAAAALLLWPRRRDD